MNIEFVLKDKITEYEFWQAENICNEFWQMENNCKDNSDYIDCSAEFSYACNSYKELMENECEQEIIIKNSNEVIGTTYVILTSKKLMNDYLKKNITEKDLLLKSTENTCYEAIYISIILIKQEYRRKRLTYESIILLIKSMIAKFQLNNPIIYFLAFSNNGLKLINKIANDLNLEVLYCYQTA